MTTILDIPDTVSDAGTEFNWGLWNEDTVLTLCNVNWNNDYRDIVRFPTRDAFDAWIDNTPNLPINDLSYMPFQRNVMIPTPFNAAMNYNYVRAKNSLAPIPGEQQRTYYYFILDVQYVAPESTQLTLQLDVWQTFGYDVSFGSCWVERGHIGIANANGFANYGRDYLSELEGLDIGGEYRIVHGENNSILGTSDSYYILVCSTVDLTIDPGTVDAPLLQTAPGGTFQSTPSGASWYYFKTLGDFSAFMESIATAPWIGQGIISITAIPPFTRYYPGFTETPVTVNGVTFYQAPGQSPSPYTKQAFTDWRNADFITNILGPRYAGLKKFLTYPYMVIELTTWTGSPVVLKPESWQDPHATVRELSAMVPPGQRVAIMPSRYNADAETVNPATEHESDEHWDDYGEFLDVAVTLDNFPAFALVNNMALGFLASNRNGLNFSFQAADWGQQRALAGAQAGAAVADAGIRNMSQQAGIGNAQQAGQTDIGVQAAIGHGILGAGGDIVGASGRTAASAIVGGATSAALSAANTATTVIAMNHSAALGQATRNASTSANMNQAATVRDTNLGYAQFAARGDYQTAIAGTIAKMQDARMTQPSTSGQVGGDAFNLINGAFGWSLRWKMLGLKALRRIGDFWLRYGYSVNQYVSIPTNLMVMSKFTYWKLSETYLSAAPMPETFKQTIRGIFEKGVTVWADPAFIGNTDWADNTPVNGISY